MRFLNVHMDFLRRTASVILATVVIAGSAALSSCNGAITAELPEGAKPKAASLSASVMCSSWQPEQVIPDIGALNDGTYSPYWLTDIGNGDILEINTGASLTTGADLYQRIWFTINALSPGWLLDKCSDLLGESAAQIAICSSACDGISNANLRSECILDQRRTVVAAGISLPGDGATSLTSSVPSFFTMRLGAVPAAEYPEDVEAISFAPCDIEAPEYNVTATSQCLFAFDGGSGRPNQTKKSVLIFRAPSSVDELTSGDPMPLVGRVYFDIPGDDGGMAAGASTDFDSFDVHPGIVSGKAARKRNVKLEDRAGHGDWYMVSRSVVAGGSAQSKLLPTHVYRIGRADWVAALAKPEGQRVIALGPDTANPPLGDIPLPYLVGLDMKTKKIDLTKPPYSDYMTFLNPTMRKKVEALYSGDFSSDTSIGMDVEAESDSGEKVSIRDVVNKGVWLEQGGSNPFGTMVATDFKFAGDGLGSYIWTYSQFFEGRINFMEPLPDTKTWLIENLSKFHDNPNPLVQMDTMALASEYDSDGNFLGETIYFTTETEEALRDGVDAKAELWKLQCADLLLKKK